MKYERKFIISMYGLMYLSLLEHDMIEKEYGTPIKSKEFNKQEYDDIFKIYEFFASKIKGISSKELNEEAQLFNEFSKKLHDDYQLNQMLMTLFMIELYILNHCNKAIQIMLEPKVKRSIKYVKKRIEESNNNTYKSIIKDSTIAANNVYRMFDGDEQITKEEYSNLMSRIRNYSKE